MNGDLRALGILGWVAGGGKDMGAATAGFCRGVKLGYSNNLEAMRDACRRGIEVQEKSFDAISRHPCPGLGTRKTLGNGHAARVGLAAWQMQDVAFTRESGPPLPRLV